MGVGTDRRSKGRFPLKFFAVVLFFCASILFAGRRLLLSEELSVGPKHASVTLDGSEYVAPSEVVDDASAADAAAGAADLTLSATLDTLAVQALDATTSSKLPHEPDLRGLIDRIGAALRPFQQGYWARFGALKEELNCKGDFTGPTNGFLPGCADDHCRHLPSLDEAKYACLRYPSCHGITKVQGGYEMRAGLKVMSSPGQEKSWLKPRCGNWQAVTPSAVLDAFAGAMQSALKNATLNLDVDLGSPREDNSIFIAISAYRDTSCSATLRKAFARADHPELVNVGIVQQNCNAKCINGIGWAETRRMVPGPPDPDCASDFCSSIGKVHCDAGRVRIIRLSEPEALGPLFARYLNAKQWRGENFFLQIDAHTNFRSGWDTSLIDMLRQTRSYPNSVLSNYPPSGKPEDEAAWPRNEGGRAEPGSAAPLCGIDFERLPGSSGESRSTIRLEIRNFNSGRGGGSAGPTYSAFMAAGFFFTHASFLKVAPPDPFMPFVFMGEEIAVTLRLWTAGFDVYRPSYDVLAHEYVRSHSTKFWETVGLVFSMGSFHNDITHVIIQRMQHLLGFPNAQRPEQVSPKSVLTMIEHFGPGTVRSKEDFLSDHGIDLINMRQSTPKWCTDGTPGPHARPR